MHPLLLALVWAILVALLISCLVLYVLVVSPRVAQRRLQSNGLIGPNPSFPLGNLPELSTKGSMPPSTCVSHDIHSRVFPYFAKWRKSYGKVFIYWLGTEPFLYVADPEFLKKATAGALDKCWGKPDVFKYDRKPMFGKGLVMVDGEDWSRHRNIIAPAFSATNLKAMTKKMVESTTKMISNWKKHVAGNNSQINIQQEVMRNAAEIIAKISFGIGESEAGEVYEKLLSMQNMLFSTNRHVGVPFSRILHLNTYFKAKALGEEIDNHLLSIINTRRAQQVDRKDGDLLGILLAASQETAEAEKKLTARELVDECKTFFFGGHETTGLTLTWTLLLLAEHQECQCALREEISEVFGEGDLDAAMLSKLVKMESVLNETLRLYPSAPNTQRQAKSDVRIGSMVIPKGTNMWIDTVGMHHDQAFWGPDANEFRPERFKDSPTGRCTHRMGFLPFGYGGRLCIGRNLTRLEYKVVLSLVLREFHVGISSEYKHSPAIVLTLRPTNGVQLVLRPVDKMK